jgi:hypothetical protein
MRNRLALAAVFVALGAGEALACGENQQPLYQCETAQGGVIDLCANGEPGAWTGAQISVRPTQGAKQSFVFPKNPATGLKAFRFSHSTGKDGYLVNIRFDRGQSRYRLFSLYTPPDPNDENDMGGGDAGLEISGKDGKVRSTIQCGEVPNEFIEYMRQAFACDRETPYGAAGCAFDAPDRDTLPPKGRN